MNELDEILLEQLHIAKILHKKMKRAKKIMNNDPIVDVFIEMNEKKTQYLESMIQDKTLLHKKVKKKKKDKDSDLFARHPVYEWYRTALYITVLGYKTVSHSMREYVSLFRKGKD